jgi:hypothetical protein
MAADRAGGGLPRPHSGARRRARFPVLEGALTAGTWPEREDALVEAYEVVARRHNGLGLTEHVDPVARPYFSRPFRVIGGDRFAEACVAAIDDPVLRALPLVGGIDQLTDTTDVLTPLRRRQFAALYPGL